MCASHGLLIMLCCAVLLMLWCVLRAVLLCCVLHAHEQQSSHSNNAIGVLWCAAAMFAVLLQCVLCRSTEPPGQLELALARRWLLLCLRCTGEQASCCPRVCNEVSHERGSKCLCHRRFVAHAA